MAISIEKFRENFRGQGFRTNLFEVNGNFPAQVTQNLLNSQKIPFLCRAASIPASTIGVVEVPFRGRTVKLPGDRTFDDWTITVLMDGFGIRNAFEQWSTLLNSHAGNSSYFDQGQAPAAGGPNDYLQNWSVFGLGRDGKVQKDVFSEVGTSHYELVGCFPSALGEVDLNADATTAVGEFTVTVSYQYWTNTSTALGGFAGGRYTEPAPLSNAEAATDE